MAFFLGRQSRLSKDLVISHHQGDGRVVAEAGLGAAGLVSRLDVLAQRTDHCPLPIPGTSSLLHLEEVLGAATIALKGCLRRVEGVLYGRRARKGKGKRPVNTSEGRENKRHHFSSYQSLCQ